ncbi:MAG TPA: hypothetical protein VM032_08310, partial [Vicinamibacterales bacterium]|nr:hypothetical protein [Vicinamibacterales bacterium]
MMRALLSGVAAAWLWSVFVAASPGQESPGAMPRQHAGDLFVHSDNCLACHNGLRGPTGEDVSIGADWRSSMMANSGRDPYWIASVRREIAEHATAGAAIQDECSVCHLPMARTTHRAEGKLGEIFSHMPPRYDADGLDRLAHDGVSCTVCHQITAQKFGTPESYTGGYVIDTRTAAPRPMYGPFEVDKGRTTVMRSSSGFRQEQAAHIQQSELCATCHTLITTALGPRGDAIGRLPEQMPYEEWKHSAFASTRSCQSCHMPTVEEDTAISSVLGKPRRLARHQFVGGNFFMLRMLNRYRDDLAVIAPSTELDRSVSRTIAHLQKESAAVSIDRQERSATSLGFEVSVQNLSGHKLPTGYPSRRVWLHVTVRDRGGRAVFESGGIAPDGAIAGNDHDRDAAVFEPHYSEISGAGQVQIYESVMGDASGRPTTGLLNAVRFLKDNRLLPQGFDKATASADIAVV